LNKLKTKDSFVRGVRIKGFKSEFLGCNCKGYKDFDSIKGTYATIKRKGAKLIFAKNQLRALIFRVFSRWRII
jgi:hypothetical protein